MKKNIIRQFLSFLTNDGITELSGLGSKILLNYLGFISVRRPSSMGAVTPTIRSFLSYLHVQGVTSDAFASLLSMRCIKRSTIKPVFAKDEAEKIIACIDRSCVKGKRDYAMLMLAKNNGLRSSDILALKLSNVDWRKAEISILQKKTGYAFSRNLRGTHNPSQFPVEYWFSICILTFSTPQCREAISCHTSAIYSISR